MRKRIFTLLFAFVAIASGAWAQTLTYIDLGETPYCYWSSYGANPTYNGDASGSLANNIGNTIDMGGTIWGTSSVDNDKFTVLDDYQVMLIKRSASSTGYIRLMFNRQASGVLTELDPGIEESGYEQEYQNTQEYVTLLDDGVTWSVDLAKFKQDYGYVHLNAIRVGWSASATIEEVKVGRDGGTAINAEHFPDDNFRAYINSNFDTNHDGNLSNAEMEAVTKIEHNYGSGIISDLTGIELFTELETLDLYKHKIQTVNLSNNKKLKEVSLEGYDEQSGLASLDVTGCTELEKLFVHVNHLTELDLSNNTKLQWLVCTHNQLTTLDLSNCSSLLYLLCCINNISGEGMDALVNSLPTVTEGYLFPFYSYVYTPEELALSPYQQEANIITDVQVAVAKGKGWKVLDYYNSEEYEGVDIHTPAEVDITVEPESGDIAEAVAAEAKKVTDAGNIVGDIVINLTSGATYTIGSTITAPGNVIINGNGATVDASSMSAPLITLNGGTTYAPMSNGTPSDHFLVDNVTIKDVTINGLKDALVKDAQKSLVETVTIENSVVEMPAAGKNVLDFNGKGYAGKVIVKNSTIWSTGKNTGFFAQYGSRPKNINGDWLQEFDVENSTIVNIANGKNFCDLKQNGTAQNVYTIKNNIFSDCGKGGQVVVGFNKGQTSATPVWDVDGNTFLVNGADNSAAEISKAGQKDGEDIVKNSLTSDPEFADAANGDFTIGATTEQAEDETGDPRWLVPYAGGEVDNSALLAEIDEAKKLLKYSMPYYDENNTESPETEGKALVDAIRDAEEQAESATSQTKIDNALEALKQAEIDYADAEVESELDESEAILAIADPDDELAAELQRLYDTQDVVRANNWNQPKNIKNYADRLDEAQKAYLRNALNNLIPVAQAASDGNAELQKAIDDAKKALGGDRSEELFEALQNLLAAMETATGISSLEADEIDAPVYNMAGQRVGKNVKGIVIKNGKKYSRK